MDEIIARVPPNDVQAEQAVLGLMLVDKDAVLTVIEMLKPDDFYKTEHEEIYGAILDLYEASKAIDLLTLKEQLRLRGKYDIINGFEYLVSLTNPMYSISNVEYYADIVKEISSHYFSGCYQVRNEWMVDKSSLVIAVFSGQKSGTKNTLDYAKGKGIKVVNVLDSI